MGSGTQLDGLSSVQSFEDPAGFDPETNEEVLLGDLLSSQQDDPSMTATRTIDWEDFLGTHDQRYGNIVCDLLAGKNSMEASRHRNEPYSRIRQLKEDLAGDLLEYFGSDAIADSMHVPLWRGNVRVDQEKALCRAERRH